MIGLDIARQVFQVHGVDAHGGVIIRQRLRRSEGLDFFESLKPCLVGIEACATDTTGRENSWRWAMMSASCRQAM